MMNIYVSCLNMLCLCLSPPFSPGAIYEDHRKKWLSGFALGPLHYTEWRYYIVEYEPYCYTNTNLEMDIKAEHI